MELTSGVKLCITCDTSVELPANFCDMCGTSLISEAVPDKISTAEWQGPVVRIAISTVAVGFGIYLLQVKGQNTSIFLLFLPLIIGTIAGAMNIEPINTLQTSLASWVLGKLERFKEGRGKIRRYFLSPWHWLLNAAISTEQRISNPYLRSGFSVAAFLYICSLMIFIAYVAISFVVAMIIIGVAFWALSFFLDGGMSPTSTVVKTVRRKDTGAEKLLGKKLYDTSGLIRREVGQVDEDGKVYDTTGARRRQVAEIDSYGNIRDTTGFKDKMVAKISNDGTISDTTGFLNKEVGKIDKDGRVLNTKGVFNKEVGKAE